MRHLWGATLMLVLPGLLLGQDGEAVSKKADWYLEKLRLYTDEVIHLYPDEWKAKAGMRQDIEQIVSRIEQLLPEGSEGRAQAYLYQGLIRCAQDDTAQVRQFLTRALQEDPQAATPVSGSKVTGEQLLADLENLQEIPFRLVGFSRDEPLPVHCLAWERRGETGEYTEIGAADIARLSMSYLARHSAARSSFTIPVPHGIFRIATYPGEDEVIRPVVFRVDSSGGVVAEESSSQDTVVIMRNQKFELVIDPPEFTHLALRSLSTGILFKGRGSGHPGNGLSDDLSEIFPAHLPVDRYVVEEFGHLKEVENLKGSRLAFCASDQDVARAIRDGFKAYVVRTDTPLTIELSQAPSLARFLPRVIPATAGAILFFLCFGNTGQVVR